VARVDLEAEQTAVTPFRSSLGRLDDEIADVRMLDAILLASAIVVAFEAGLRCSWVLVFGPRHEADGEQVDDAWVECDTTP
jgi:hypothetical protein